MLAAANELNLETDYLWQHKGEVKPLAPEHQNGMEEPEKGKPPEPEDSVGTLFPYYPAVWKSAETRTAYFFEI